MRVHAMTLINGIDIEDHFGLIGMVLKRYHALQDMTYEDLFQEGVFGLMRAAERFDPSRGVTFGTYAVWWIRQSINRAIQNKGRCVRVPVHKQESVSKSKERVPSTVSLHVPVSNKENASDSQWIDMVSNPEPEDAEEHGLDHRLLEEGLAMLKPRERDILRRRFGLDDDKDETLEQIGAEYGITRERIRQVEAVALRKLRAAIGES